MWVYTVGTNNYVSLSKLNIQVITTWGIQMVERMPINLNHCEDLDHDYLAPFHLGNPELLIRYQKVMQKEDCERKTVLIKTKVIANNKTIIHKKTQSHCYDSPYKTTDYDEYKWTVILYHSIQNNIPNSINAMPSNQNKTRVASLLKIIQILH